MFNIPILLEGDHTGTLGVVSLTEDGLAVVNALSSSRELLFVVIRQDENIIALDLKIPPDPVRVRNGGMEEQIRYHLDFMRAYGGWNDPSMVRHKDAFRKLVQVRRRNRQMLQHVQRYSK